MTMLLTLLLLPQRYEFSSKSQHEKGIEYPALRCCCYRKGTNFQANHNDFWHIRLIQMLLLLPQRYEFSSKSQLDSPLEESSLGCCCYRKGTNFQANHNAVLLVLPLNVVVVATAKVRIFKQITTNLDCIIHTNKLLLLPQRYEFSSKSQRNMELHATVKCCCCYRKGTNFQANHNKSR